MSYQYGYTYTTNSEQSSTQTNTTQANGSQNNTQTSSSSSQTQTQTAQNTEEDKIYYYCTKCGAPVFMDYSYGRDKGNKCYMCEYQIRKTS